MSSEEYLNTLEGLMHKSFIKQTKSSLLIVQQLSIIRNGFAQMNKGWLVTRKDDPPLVLPFSWKPDQKIFLQDCVVYIC